MSELPVKLFRATIDALWTRQQRDSQRSHLFAPLPKPIIAPSLSFLILPCHGKPVFWVMSLPQFLLKSFDLLSYLKRNVIITMGAVLRVSIRPASTCLRSYTDN